MWQIHDAAGNVLATHDSVITASEDDVFVAFGHVWLDPKPSDGAYVTEVPDPPPPAPDYSALAATHWQAIKTERDRRTQQGGYQVDGKWFHSDTFSRTQQLALVMMGASIPAGLQWKTMDGSFVTMTQTLASQVFTAAAASDAALFARAEQIKATMESDPVNFILSAQPWPSVYGE